MLLVRQLTCCALENLESSVRIGSEGPGRVLLLDTSLGTFPPSGSCIDGAVLVRVDTSKSLVS